MIRNIIFDWSGTLVDDLPATWQATNHVFRMAGLPEMSLDRFRAEFCLPFSHFYDRYTPHLPMPQLEAWFHSHFRTVQDSVAELPHAREFLVFCRKRGLRTFLLSSVHRDHFAAQTARNGFDAYLDEPYLGVLDKRTKILEILAEHHLDPTETLFIGDMQHDIETAQHGGIHSCAVLTGFNGVDQLRAAQPDLIVEHLGELQGILERNGMDLISLDADPAGHNGRMPVATVGGLIYNDAGQVLMIQTQKWSQLWGIPGGKIKFGEASIDALRRELKEETDLDITDIEFVFVQDCIHSTEFYRDAHFILLNYTCRARPGGAVQLNEEAQQYQWVTPEQALAMALNRPTRRLLETVLRKP